MARRTYNWDAKEQQKAGGQTNGLARSGQTNATTHSCSGSDKVKRKENGFNCSIFKQLQFSRRLLQHLNSLFSPLWQTIWSHDLVLKIYAHKRTPQVPSIGQCISTTTRSRSDYQWIQRPIETRKWIWFLVYIVCLPRIHWAPFTVFYRKFTEMANHAPSIGRRSPNSAEGRKECPGVRFRRWWPTRGAASGRIVLKAHKTITRQRKTFSRQANDIYI